MHALCTRLILFASVFACTEHLAHAVETTVQKTKTHPEATWQSLFDGKSLGQWEETDFGGKDEVTVRNGTIVLAMATADLSGITWKGEVHPVNYEIELQAKRVKGSDFFCGLTFPYKTSHCTLIVGGWGGTLVGLSSFDNLDASQNETTCTREFKTGEWYTIRLRVRDNHIEAWIQGKKLIDARPYERTVSVRYEVEPSRPLGIAAWNTEAALKNIRMRTLPPAEIKDDAQ